MDILHVLCSINITLFGQIESCKNKVIDRHASEDRNKKLRRLECCLDLTPIGSSFMKSLRAFALLAFFGKGVGWLTPGIIMESKLPLCKVLPYLSHQYSFPPLLWSSFSPYPF